MPAAARRAPKPDVVDTLKVMFALGDDYYLVTPLDADRRVATKAFRLEKVNGDKANYDVHQSPLGHLSCECLGFINHQKPCKHIRALRKARML